MHPTSSGYKHNETIFFCHSLNQAVIVRNTLESSSIIESNSTIYRDHEGLGFWP